MEPNSQNRSRAYRISREGFAFVLDPPNVDRLKKLPDFEGREEPAVAEDFLRSRAEAWVDVLSSAGAEPGEVLVEIDPHQKKARLGRARRILITADI
jgi:hypothetical protein